MGLSALWWWVDRWRRSSAYMHMTLEEQGAYRNLLDEAALRGGPLPNDARILAKASGDALRWRYVRKAVLKHFQIGVDGALHNATLDSVLAESARRAEAQKRYRHRQIGHNKGHNGDHNGSHNNPHSPSPSPSLIKNKSGKLCPHSPRCETRHACIAKTLTNARRRNRSAS